MQRDNEDMSRFPWMVRQVLKTGVVKTRKQAELILIGFATLSILVALWTFLGVDSRPVPNPLDDPNYEPGVAR